MMFLVSYLRQPPLAELGELRIAAKRVKSRAEHHIPTVDSFFDRFFRQLSSQPVSEASEWGQMSIAKSLE